MLERPAIWLAASALLASACTLPQPAATPRPPEAPVAAPAAAAEAPAAPAPDPAAEAAKSRAALTEQARALLAQAETDVQRARAKRALWQKAWEDLLLSREALAANDPPRAIRHATRASELARLGLEQLAYPAVK